MRMLVNAEEPVPGAVRRRFKEGDKDYPECRVLKSQMPHELAINPQVISLSTATFHCC